MPDDDGDRVLVGIDRHGDAQLSLEQAALAGLPEGVRQVRVVDVGFVYPDPAAQDYAILVAIHGREHALAPLIGNLVVQPADLRDAP